MNTDIELRTVDPVSGAYLAAAASVFTDIDRRFSRFRPDSELSLLNCRHSSSVALTPDMSALLSVALDMHALTGGIFDPSVISSLEGLGYDRSFELITDGGEEAGEPERAGDGFGAIEIDRVRQRAYVPPGLRIEFGGIGKGYAVDRAAEILRPCRDFLVNAGGDIYASGSDGHHDGWTAAIEHPHTGKLISTVVLRAQALATSTTARRTWVQAEMRRHHIIDPRARGCSDSGVASVSVIADTAVRADVFAKTALILGETAGGAFLSKVGCPGLFVLDGGSVHATGPWPDGSDSDGGVACSDA